MNVSDMGVRIGEAVAISGPMRRGIGQTTSCLKEPCGWIAQAGVWRIESPRPSAAAPALSHREL
jgi:hypothetical protein